MSAKPFVFDTDVLIIGGGFSGSWAALTARQHVENVLIVDKGPRDWGGLGGMSGGDMIVKQPEFAAKDLVEELVYYYDGLCEQDVLEEILNQSYERFKDYEKMGHEFARDDSGRLMSIPQRGLELMRYYFYHPYGKGGAHTTQILNAELQRLNVQRIGRIEITDLVKDGDAVSGAVGFHAQSGTPCLFRAKAVILAAHNGGWKGSYLLNTCAGEGAALAYGAGASLRNHGVHRKLERAQAVRVGRTDRDAPLRRALPQRRRRGFHAPLFPEARSQGRPALQRARHGL